MTIATAPLLQGSRYEAQEQLEIESVREAALRYRRLAAETVDRGEGASLKPVERMLAYWHRLLAAMIGDEQERCEAGEQAPFRSIYAPLLLSLDPDRLAVVVMDRTVAMCLKEPGGARLSGVCHAVGASVLAEINAGRLRKENAEEYAKLTKRFRNLNAYRINWWARRHLDNSDVNRAACVQTGAILLKLLMGAASLGDYETEVFRPAIEERRFRHGKRTTRVVQFTREARDLIEDGHSIRQHLRPRFLPMIVTPVAWTVDEKGRPLCEGGYTRIRTPFMSKPSRAQKAALATADLTQVYDCLNAVNGTAWRPRLKVLAVAKVYYEQGGGVLGMPRRDPVPAPAKPAGYDVAAPRGQRWAAVDPAVKKAYKRDANAAIKTNLQAASARSELIQKLALAERFAGRTIFFPHQFDFRGRNYPIPLHLNHQGDDLCRGLLEFAEGKPCVGEAQYWLKVDAANSWGLDKLSYDQRVAWIEENMPQVRRVAADPLGFEWWHDAEEPWQFLAACYALTDPEAAAHHPVKMDGSCNGLAHYTAMGRDERAARFVNMTPADHPESLYLEVAGNAKLIVDDDIRLGHPYAQVVETMVEKDTVKQPVMTSVYGVTMVGARDQVIAKLKARGLAGDELYKASDYLSKVVMGGVAQACPGASAIMAWLRTLATLVTKQNRLVAWRTPLGLPVVQPYRRWKQARVTTVLAQLRLRIDDEDVPVNIAEHCNAFAPNFVHSIDATHWLMVARMCVLAGITIAGVHDSYWTHAATRPALARIARERFVALHKQPLLQDLLMQLRFEHPDIEFPEPPPLGSYDLASVLVSPYFFS